MPSIGPPVLPGMERLQDGPGGGKGPEECWRLALPGGVGAVAPNWGPEGEKPSG